MPDGLQFLSAVFFGNAFPQLFLPSGFSLTPSAEASAPFIPSFTPGQEAARQLELQAQQFEFERETRRTDLALESELRTDALIRLQEERRLGRARDLREFQREERRIEQARKDQEQLLMDRQAFELEGRRRDVEDRNAAAELAAVIRSADNQRRLLEVALRGAPRGTVPFIDPRGAITFRRFGESETEEQLRLGQEALRFQPPAPTASRFTQVPGVFVGPGFRFRNVVEAQNFLSDSRTQGQRRVRARGSSRSFAGGIV